MSTTGVIWYAVRGESPTNGAAVEPGPLGITIPRDVLIWAEGHGLTLANPDVYILVAPAEQAGDVPGEIAYLAGELPAADVALIRQVL